MGDADDALKEFAKTELKKAATYPWQRGKIIKVVQACVNIKSLFVVPEQFSGYKAGQHYELCLPDENVIRKYSPASPIQNKDYVEFGVELIERGALSPKLWELKEGDELEMRGPIGRSFVWETSHSGPLVLIGAGSGMTPLLSIYHSYKYFYPEGECVFIMTAKDPSRVMHYEQLKDILVMRFTRTEGRIDLEFLKEKIGELIKNKNTMYYISGPGSFVNDMVDNMHALGIMEDKIQTERFI